MPTQKEIIEYTKYRKTILSDILERLLNGQEISKISNKRDKKFIITFE